ncbi:FAD-binding oxidoreductase [Rhodobacter sp. 24-YEA-8]|uniref:NAD(P)/FAD-dependent oxidoreductase n=1 Tax=Rhodobacter sp. 24-YEA-8 TaxID=1884310 RepID=UPI000895178E|nr:FAD-dependent oxidoreductase [Rhodobacter sp. 24-YEA-8]SEC15874.1 D-amino-acid dehydrogenase [Rhodobacter sp. 24-YEA-8]
MGRYSSDITIIGAGVIGLTIAARLIAEGREVTLIEPGEPGMGASYGNAGTVADYAVAPVGTPDVLKSLPSLLFNHNSPLAIRHSALLSLTPWLVKFARQSLPGPARRNTEAIAGLLAGANPLWKALAAEAGATDLIRPRGCLYIFREESQLGPARIEMEARRRLGVQVEMLTGGQLAGLEPGLPFHAGAAYFPQAIFLSDPGRMMQRLAALVMPRAQLIRGRIDQLRRDITGVVLNGRSDDGSPLQILSRRVVIAAGAHSRALAAQAGDRIPLETERGYHVEWDMAELPLTRPACVTERGFYLCPMQGRLRVAGTVELGGLRLPPSPHRIAKLVEGARKLFPDLPGPSRSWMGFRPSIPDSVPVIGPSKGGADVLLAFGHGHIGLTLAPKTADLITDLIQGRSPGAELTPALPSRF